MTTGSFFILTQRLNSSLCVQGKPEKKKSLTCVFSTLPDGATLRAVQPSEWSLHQQRFLPDPTFLLFKSLVSFQALRIRGAEAGKHNGQRQPHLRGAGPGPAGQRHRQLCVEDNRLADPMRSRLNPPLFARFL